MAVSSHQTDTALSMPIHWVHVVPEITTSGAVWYRIANTAVVTALFISRTTCTRFLFPPNFILALSPNLKH